MDRKSEVRFTQSDASSLIITTRSVLKTKKKKRKAKKNILAQEQLLGAFKIKLSTRLLLIW